MAKTSGSMFSWNKTISHMLDEGLMSGSSTAVVAAGAPDSDFQVSVERRVLMDTLGEDVCGISCDSCDYEQDESACCRFQKEGLSDRVLAKGFHRSVCYPVSVNPVKEDYYLCYVGPMSGSPEYENRYVTLFWDGSNWLLCKGSAEVFNPMFWSYLPPKPKGV